ncbi:methylmalonate-semialdehyde dehydrogenase [Grosmannia clavigera kw1407]|uniref:methylmalonate-semialdehyde dehydrogenase (CoA acylating) n=1 Tax=Grosmannia clavigera (strain kw1407 / UAMH 11150) TaxID=655863 RepID=F0XC24_GROCL|nr:methylmalonate-semialdehyde dehydrogenase [Grosmannia clavigera kw1407]EFX04453.1 methylmalonate-semialdehyde dehydrogenase [Grosmannia clavigera kw1407]
MDGSPGSIATTLSGQGEPAEAPGGCGVVPGLTRLRASGPSRYRSDGSVRLGSNASESGAQAEASQKLAYGVTYNFVANSFVLSKSRKWSKVHDPASQNFITRVPDSTSAELLDAVQAAAAAQPIWAQLTPARRRKCMMNLIPILRQHSSRIRHFLCLEVGKTLADAEAEFERGMDAVETAVSLSNEPSGSHQTNQWAEIHTMSEPLGVCLTISPFNFPFMIPLWSIPYALLAGNTVILKPSEQTPSVTQVLAECFVQASFPAGVLGILHGGASVVSGLLSQPVVRAVSFVGSDVAGEQIYEHARATRKRIQVECNGKNHGVVLEDATRMRTLYAIAGSAFGAAGQRCMAVSVAVFVGATRAWIDELVAIAKTLVVGIGIDPLVEVGPLISATAKTRVEAMITAAESEGARVALDGRAYTVPDYPQGNFVGPTILTGVQPYMTCYQEEIFGPVLCCVEVDTLDQAMELVNNNRYGNGCTLFTNSPSTAQLFQRTVNVGQIGINVPIVAPSGPI